MHDPTKVNERPGPPLGLMALLLVIVFITTFHPIYSGDLWWHLATGREVAERGAVPLADPFSYTCHGNPWTPHSWLLDWGVYEIVHRAGPRALAFCVPLAMAALLVLLHALLRKVADGSGFAALAAIVLAFFPGRVSWILRPNTASLFMMVALLWYLECAFPERRPWRAVLGIGLFMVLWANMHGGFLAGVVVLGLYALAMPPMGEVAWRCPITMGLRAWFDGRRKALVGATVLAGAAGLATPHGPAFYPYLFNTFRQKAMRAFILEWASPNFFEDALSLLVIVGTVAVLMSVRCELRLRHRLFYLLWLGAFLRSTRHMPFFYLASALILARPFAALLGRIDLRRSKLGLALRNLVENDRSPVLAAVVGGLLLVSAGALATGLRLPFEPRPLLSERHFPSETVLAAVRAIPREERILAAYRWGGFMAWTFPERKVFIDGRTFVYGAEMVDQFMQVHRRTKRWREIVKRWDVRYLLLSKEYAATARYRDEGLPVVAEDEISVLFRVL